MTIARKASATLTQAVQAKTQRSASRVVKKTSEAAAKVAADSLATQTAKKTTRRAVSQAASKALMAPPVLTKKAAALVKAAGLSTAATQKALTAGDLVFQQGIKKGLKQTEALKLANAHISALLADQKVSAELVTALTNGLRPATRAQLGKAAAAGRVSRKVKEAVGKTTPVKKTVVIAPSVPNTIGPKPVAAKPPVTPKPSVAKPLPPSSGKTPEAIRTLAADVTLLGTLAYEAGRNTRRAANATYQAGRNARAFVAQGGVTQGWQQAWARHDQAYQAMHREVMASAQNMGQKLKTLATRVIAQ